MTTTEKILELLQSNTEDEFSALEVAEILGLLNTEAEDHLKRLHSSGACLELKGTDSLTGKEILLYSSEGTPSEGESPELPGNGVILERRNHVINYLVNNGPETSVREIYYGLRDQGLEYEKKHISNDLRQLLAMGDYPLSRTDKFDMGTGKTISFWSWYGRDDEEDFEDEEFEENFSSTTEDQSISDMLADEDITTLQDFLEFMSTDMLMKIRIYLENKSKEKKYRENIIGWS